VTAICGQHYSRVQLDMYYQIQRSNQHSTKMAKYNIRTLYVILFLSIIIVGHILALWTYIINYKVKLELEMDADNFYVYLPSNVMVTRPDQVGNTIGNYVTHLATKLKLGNDWEVGLSEIRYPRTWYNIMYDQDIKLIAKDGNETDSVEFLSAGYYGDAQELINKINGHLRVLSNKYFTDAEISEVQPPILNYDSNLNKIFVITGGYKKLIPPKNREEEKDRDIDIYQTLPVFPNFLCHLLGLVDTQGHVMSFQNVTDGPSAHTKSFEAVQQVQLDASINALHVYCNIIEPVLIGNTYAQLLRQVEIPNESKFKHNCVIQYNKPYYFPLISNEISVIEMDFRDDSGHPITFTSGHSEVTLHFRKRINNVFESLRELLR
jgi:hypothetical protein